MSRLGKNLMILFEKLKFLILVLPSFILLACTMTVLTPSETPSVTPVGTYHLLDLVFEDAELEKTVIALDSCINEFVSEDEWAYFPFTPEGYFLAEGWCQGAGVDYDCTVGRDFSRDQRVIHLYTFFEPLEFPRVFGKGLFVFLTPPDTGWGVMFGYNKDYPLGPKEKFDLHIRYFDDKQEEPVAELHFGSTNYYLMDQAPMITLFSEMSVEQELPLYFASANSLRDRGLQVLDEFSEEVETKISTHQITVCDYGKDANGVYPAACTPQPLSDIEEQTELQKAQDYFVSQKKFLNENYEAMYKALLTAFPFDQCSPIE